MSNKHKNNKGFTLIELIAVIVIVGVLMIIVVPGVSRYIDNSKKEAFVKEINGLVDTVRYAINSGDSNYSIQGQTKRTFDLQNIELDKGENTIINGTLTVDLNSNSYTVKVTEDKNNYCLSSINVNELDKSKVKNCNTGYEYEIGKKIYFANSYWYVVQNATFSQDYVVLMKENNLTAAELTNAYAVSKDKGKTYLDAMAYYWDWNCHYTTMYGNTYYSFSFTDLSNRCNNNYNDSQIKTFLETVYVKTLDEDKLEFVDLNGTDYQIRLITVDELVNNLGWKSGANSWYWESGNSVPTWVYVKRYWTMSGGDGKDSVPIVDGCIGTTFVCTNNVGVRPVINLKKSAIQE